MEAFRMISDSGPSDRPSQHTPPPPLPLNHRTSSRNFHSSNGSPPSTPPPKTRRRDDQKKGKLPLRATASHQDHLSRGDDAAANHSHSLSWSSTTRDSVVDNLLFSLDNLTRADEPQSQVRYNDEERQRFLSSLSSRYSLTRAAQRVRAFTQSSSSTTASPGSMRQYSNNSTPRESYSTPRMNGRTPGHSRNVSSTPKHMHQASIASKQSVESRGVDQDFDFVIEPARRGWGRRSMSMDQIYAEQLATLQDSILDRGRPVPSVHSRYESKIDQDAAPEPYIAAGPRKMENPELTGPVYIGPAPSSKSKQSTLRKVTTQTDLRSSAGQNSAPPIPLDVRNQAADFVKTSSIFGSSTAVPEPRSPLPNSTAHDRRRDQSPPREKQGFFKRVFGGGSRAVSGPAERSSSTKMPADAAGDSANATLRSVSQTSAVSHAKNDTKPPTTCPIAQPPQSLNKKPSSFFRRRKRSMSEAVPPSPLPLNIQGLDGEPKPTDPRASVSSLRKVMDPFLTEDQNPAQTIRQIDRSRPTTADSRAEDSDDLDIFHSGYTPPADASLRALPPPSRESSIRPVSNARDSPQAKLKLKKRRPGTAGTDNLAETSFLHDASRKNSAVATTGMQSVERLPVSPVSEAIPEDGENGYLGSRPSTGEQIIASALYSPTEPDDDDDDRRSRFGDISTEPITATASDGVRPTSNNSSILILQSTSMDQRLSTPNRVHSVTSSAFSRSPESTRSPAFATARLALPSVMVEGSAMARKSSEVTDSSFVSGLIEDDTEFKERARKIFEGVEDDIARGDAAAWMGELKPVSMRTLQAYMQLFDFTGVNVLTALRMLCGNLILRGETQQFDRIITALSARWCECNPNNGFKAQDVVHTVFYSLVLLNTDLHLADIGEKMSRSAYVKNTLPTIKRVVADAAPAAFDDAFKPGSAHQLRPVVPWMDTTPASPTSPTAQTSEMPSGDGVSDPLRQLGANSSASNSAKRLSLRPGVLRNDSDGTTTPENTTGGISNALVAYSWNGPVRGWEMEIESILKSFFNSIRNEPLPLRGAMMNDGDKNLSVASSNNNLRRSNSIISKAPSDISYRSKPDFRMRWQGRGNRSRPKLYPASTIGSSRTSLDEGSSFWSPAQSSKYSVSKTLTSASVGSLGYHHSPSIDAYKHSIGFANALSQAIIREETAASGDNESFSIPGGLLEDESLALAGAPWAKEGLVKHKHHLETPDRKAKERSWVDCFAVISKGKLTLFAFNTTSKTQSLGRRNHFTKSGRAASVTGAKVGGGDWMENAEQLDVFILRQTIASTLPPPGYSKTRPHVWALSLPSGAVHLFQVGTPEIAEEFMSTANYWSARLSKEPLSGGVSNIEYGWSEQVINPALVDRPESRISTPPSSMQTRPAGHMHSMSTERARRPSLQSSLRTSIDTGFGVTGMKAKLPGDKVHIMEWHAPSQSMMASQLMEVDQLKQLAAYVAGSEDELEKHNELKHAIELAFTPRHPNHSKAMINWQRKSDHLLREIVKFRTYIDSLTAARTARETFLARKVEIEANNGGPHARGSTLSPVVKDEGEGRALSAMGRVMPRDIHTSG